MLTVAMNSTTKTGRGAGTQQKCPDCGLGRPDVDFYDSQGIGFRCKGCMRKYVAKPKGPGSNAARARVAGGSLITYQIAARRREVAKELGLKVYPNASKWINNEKNAKELGWLHNEWALVDTEARKRYEAQPDAAVVRPQPDPWTREDQDLAELIGIRFGRRAGISFGLGQNDGPSLLDSFETVRGESTESYMLTSKELAEDAKANGWLCWLCGEPLNTFVERDGSIERSKTEQLHYPAIIVAQKNSITPSKAHAHAGHEACNDVMGSKDFGDTPLDKVKSLLNAERKRRRIEFTSDVESEEIIIPAHMIPERRQIIYRRPA